MMLACDCTRLPAAIVCDAPQALLQIDPPAFVERIVGSARGDSMWKRRDVVECFVELVLTPGMWPAEIARQITERFDVPLTQGAVNSAYKRFRELHPLRIERKGIRAEQARETRRLEVERAKAERRLKLKRPSPPPKADGVKTKPILVGPQSFLQPLPESACVPVWDLKASKQCVWPLGDSLDADDFRYCGAPKVLGRSYCPDHHRRSVRRVK